MSFKRFLALVAALAILFFVSVLDVLKPLPAASAASIADSPFFSAVLASETAAVESTTDFALSRAEVILLIAVVLASLVISDELLIRSIAF